MRSDAGETALDAFVNFWNALDTMAMLRAALRLVAVLLCLTVHETCHGLAAYALGDPTAKSMHRLSLNPLHHIDWLGLAAMMTLGFGWAKPVPVDMRYFKHPKQGMALTALAGPASNLLFACLTLLGARAVLYGAADTAAWGWFYWFLLLLAQMNVGLGVFNLIPISPLDGSKVLFAMLPDAAYAKLMRYERYGVILLYALIFFGALDGFLSRAVSGVYSVLINLIFA
ncbi:MAG: site-2 protease family protein [Oscillospiraceae bacterium]|nr:site-2 protease family protein [Oscillospiraceae bacterium]